MRFVSKLGSSMGSFLPEELLLSLNNQIPCREAQIRQVAALLDVSLHRVRFGPEADLIVAQLSQPPYSCCSWWRGHWKELDY